MISYIAPIHINDFLKKALKNHDDAHDISHAWRVYLNAVFIANSEEIALTDKELEEFPLVILCHDVLDHKIKNPALHERDVMKFYVDCVGVQSAVKIDYIHKNCSWSNRKSATPLTSGDWMRKVLQDADWLDALGYDGLVRCMLYTKTTFPDATEEELKKRVQDHIREKLLLIPEELNFETSKRLVIERGLMTHLLNYLEN